MKKKLCLKILAGTAAVLLTALMIAGNCLASFAIARKKGVNMAAVPASSMAVDEGSRIQQNTNAIRRQTEEWLASAEREDVQVISEDGLTLRGDLFRAPGSHLWVVAVHGYTGKRTDMYGIASFYAARGWNVLAPDMRSHGESDGSYIGMGWLDRKDILKWLEYIVGQDAQARIILHGISMGGAAVMMTSGEELPPQVKGIVEDCGYTSVWDIFSDELSYLFHLPDFPVLYVTDLMARLRAGYGFREASALRQVAKSKVPIMFIHGSDDSFVHTDMVYELYDACQSPKDLLVVQGAKHGQSYAADPKLYFETVFAFFERECLLGK